MNFRIDRGSNPAARAQVRTKKRFHFSAQFEIAIACLVQQEIALASIAFCCAMK
jgi:hypothetical protein